MGDFEVEWEQGIDYVYACRTCVQEWMESHRLDDPGPAFCPTCESEDIYRCVGSAGFTLVGGGVGWSSEGYYRNGAYDRLQEAGSKVELFDSSAECERVIEGEREEKEHRKLKYRHELEKKIFGSSTVKDPR
jgi:predicted nucleic acid-binding Zn ribbon protein